MSTLLFIGDDAPGRERARRLLGARHALVEAADARTGLGAVQGTPLDGVLLGEGLPPEEGRRVLEALADGAVPVMTLPPTGDELALALVERALEARLRADDTRKRLCFVLEQLPIVQWTTDASLTVTEFGGGSARRLSLDGGPSVGRVIGAGAGSEDLEVRLQREHERAAAGETRAFRAELAGRNYGAHVGPRTDAEGRVIGTMGVALDVTEACAVENQLRHAVKMEALGRLAGGVAHDFNNLLSAILGFAGYARGALPPGDPIVEDLDEVLKAGRRAADLVKQLLTFSRPHAAAPRAVDVGDMVESTLPTLRRMAGADVRITHASAEGLWPCRIDPGLLEQVLVNLVINACDAMPGGGAIDLEVKNVPLAEALTPCGRHRLDEGDYVVISVSDDGEGIPKEIQDRVFEPFFTTKDAGRGSGLGLSTVYGIARQVGGAVTLYSEPGRGSTFRVYLPRLKEGADAPRAAVITPLGHETILVVEDDAAVRALAVRTLEHLGYRVLHAADAEGALLHARDERAPDLVLCDVVLAGRAGVEVVAEVQSVRPEARVLYMSGYTERTARARGRLPDAAPVIEKPLVLDRLGRMVREVLA